jgi:hypothetical protein
MNNTLKMPSYEYNYELIDLQQISYKQFIDSSIPEEVLLAILCNFGQVDAEVVVEEIFIKLRLLQKSDLAFGKSIKQLDVLSLLRDLQPFIVKQEQKMALTLKIENDLRFQQGEKLGEKRKALEIATAMLREGLDKQTVAKITRLSPEEIDKLEKEWNKKEC